MLIAFRMKKMQAKECSSRSLKAQGNWFVVLLERVWSCQYLDFSPVKLTSELTSQTVRINVFKTLAECFCPTKIPMLNPDPQGDGIRSWAAEKLSGQERAEPSWMGLVSLWKRSKKVPLPRLPCEGTVRRHCLRARELVSPDIKTASPSISDSLASKPK